MVLAALSKTRLLFVYLRLLFNAGVMNQANNFIGKLVQIPVYVRVWSMEGREGVTYNISSDGGITE
ncbi:Uncharacterised protein [Citrobacter freundii]|nr:Uncharacterised protein [Citrobacter freundii]